MRHDFFDHLIAEPDRFGESWSKELRIVFEAITICLERTERNAFRPGLWTLSQPNVLTALEIPMKRPERPTRAANVNSKSSDRKVLSSMAVLITSSRRASLRNRYSVTPSHIRKSWFNVRWRTMRSAPTHRSRTDHVFVGNDSQFPPTVYYAQ